VLGLDLVDGVRWDALGHTTGRLSARALRESLPRRDGVAALTWYAGSHPRPLQAFAAREALSAARRGHDTVVVDLPRVADALTDEIAARCDQVLVTVVTTVAGVAAAMRTCGRFADPGVLGLVVRGSGMDDETLARATKVPVLHRMADQRGLAESIDIGLGPVRSRRGPLGRAASSVLSVLADRASSRAA
jgi:secretion/DNA translocation related CpaE-like protein